MQGLYTSAKRVYSLISCQLPAACVVCGQDAECEYSICNDCEQTLPRLNECCRRCGIEVKGSLTIDSCCGSCLHKPPNFNFCKSIYSYTSPINKLVASFKFSARFDIGYSLSRILAREMNNYYRTIEKPQILIPVPLHWKRLRSRGFNQASEIGKVVSTQCQIPIQESVLIKTRSTLPQIEMASALARRSNLRGAFSLRQSEPMKTVTHIALIDDVVTTMATAETLATLLQDVGVHRIDVWCLARAGH